MNITTTPNDAPPANALYLVTFHGDGPVSRLCQGIDAVKAFLCEHCGEGEANAEALAEEGNWTHHYPDSIGRWWTYHFDAEDYGLTVQRVTEAPLLQRIADACRQIEDESDRPPAVDAGGALLPDGSDLLNAELDELCRLFPPAAPQQDGNQPRQDASRT